MVTSCCHSVCQVLGLQMCRITPVTLMKIWIRIIHNKQKWFTIWEIYGSFYIIFVVIHCDDLKHELLAMRVDSHRSGRGSPCGSTFLLNYWLLIYSGEEANTVFTGVPIDEPTMFQLVFPNPWSHWWPWFNTVEAQNNTKRHECGKESQRMMGNRGGREIRDGGDEVNKKYIEHIFMKLSINWAKYRKIQ